MGLFSSEYERMSGFQYADLGHNSIDSYFSFRRQLLFAAAGDAEYYQMEMWKYKSKYRRKYSQKKMTAKGFGPEEQILASKTFVEFKSITSSSLRETIIAINETPYRRAINDLNYALEVPDDKNTQDVAVMAAVRQAYGSAYIYLGGNNSFSDSVNPYNDGLHTLDTITVGSSSASYNSSGFIIGVTLSSVTRTVVMATEVTYWLVLGVKYYTLDEANAAAAAAGGSNFIGGGTEIVYSEPVITNLENYTSDDIARYSHPYVKSRRYNMGYSYYIPVLYSMYSRGYIHDIELTYNQMYAAPMITFKKDNIVDVAKDYTQDELDALTQEERDIIKKQRDKEDILRNFAINLDSIQPYLDNQDIDDFKVGLTLAPDDAVKKLEIAKVLFETLDRLSATDELLPLSDYASNGSTVEIDVSDTGYSAVTSFKLSKVTRSGSIALNYGYPSKWKVILKQNIGNQQKYREDAIESLSESGLPNDPSTMSTSEIYDIVMTKIKDEEYAGLYREDEHPLRKYIPSPSAKNNRFPQKYIYLYCKESEIEANVLKDRTYRGVIVYDIKSTRQLSLSASLLQYRASSQSLSKIELNADGEPVVVAGSVVVGMRVMKQITATEYVEYTLYDGKTTYSVGQDTVIKEYNTNDGSFRIPVHEDVLNNKTYYEFIELYDSLVSGVIFTVKVIEIKWYQQEWFQIVLIIIIIIITIVVSFFTAGSGSSIGAVLAELVLNAAIAVGVGIAIDSVLDLLGIDNPYVKIAIQLVIAMYSGDFSAVDAVMAFISVTDAYMAQENIDAIEQRERLAEQSERFFKKLNEKYKELNSGGVPESRTRESIVANIINSTKIAGTLNITETLMKSVEHSDWMAEPLNNMGMKPNTLLPEKGIIRKPSTSLPLINITMGVDNNTFVK